jgi:glycosyltransferase involved in cell wall biosynthesis
LGYQTYLLAPFSERSAKYCIDEGCEHLILNIEREISLFKDIKTLFQIIKIFKSVKPDIINLGTPKVSFLGMIAGWLLSIKVRIYTCRGFRFESEKGIKFKILVFMEKITARLSTKIICISNSLKDLGVKSKIFNESKAKVILKGSSNGIDLSLFDPNSEVIVNEASILKNNLKLKDKFVFLFVGRIYDRKGIVELFTAFDKLNKMFEDTVLVLVGPYEKNQIADKGIISKIDAHQSVYQIGRVDQLEVPLYMGLADVFVLPCWGEGFGNVLIQAAAMGVPVVSTKATGTMDAVCDRYNGILVSPKKSDELFEVLLELYQNAEQRKELGNNGIEWAKNFERETIWLELNKIYQC